MQLKSNITGRRRASSLLFGPRLAQILNMNDEDWVKAGMIMTQAELRYNTGVWGKA